MEEKHRLAEEIEFAIGLQMLATAYEEVSVIKMRYARDSVVNTRDYLVSLADVFYNVKSSYKNKVLEAMKEHEKTGKPMKFSTQKTNGKEVHVFLSANNKLYGEIISEIFTLFVSETAESPADVVIVGHVGEELYKNAAMKKPYVFFDIPDIESTIQDLKPLLAYILEYEKVTVYYGKFVNVIAQKAASLSVSGDIPSEEPHTQGNEYNFIFEPSIESLMTFFESQLFISLFKQTVHEAELARYASRIKAMEQALEYINVRIESLGLLARHVSHRKENKRQLERIAGMALWRK